MQNILIVFGKMTQVEKRLEAHLSEVVAWMRQVCIKELE